jgi:outer membrane protein OmpA-like peptidoglycan-associated protein
MQVHHSLASVLFVMLAAGCAATAPTTQETAAAPAATPAGPAKPAAAPAAAAPDSLQVLFDENSSSLSTSADGVVDHAARLFREGNPVVMTVSGHSDLQGAEYANLILSAKRAAAVKAALVARGIPAQRLEVVAYGVAEPAEPNNPTAPENRRVVITWR